MTSILDNKKVEIQCPQCKSKFSKTVQELKQRGVKCPKCGVAFETSQFKREMDKVDRTLKDLKRSLRKIKIDIKL